MLTSILSVYIHGVGFGGACPDMVGHARASKSGTSNNRLPRFSCIDTVIMFPAGGRKEQKKEVMKLLILTNLIFLVVIVLLVVYVLILHHRRRRAVVSFPIEDKSPDIPEPETDEIALKVNKWMWQVLSVPSNDLFTLENVANGIGISREELANYLKEQRKPNFRFWVSSIRLQHCYDLLNTTDYTLSEIAYMCGYADLPTMSKAFKRQYGKSPSKFRRVLSAPTMPV